MSGLPAVGFLWSTEGNAMLHALVVDDEKLTLRYLEEFLAREGFDVSTASTFKEARTELENRLPDVMLVDPNGDTAEDEHPPAI